MDQQLSPETLSNLEILQHVFDEYNHTRTHKVNDVLALPNAVREFNDKQRSYALRSNKPCTTPEDLFNLYRDNYSIVVAHTDKKMLFANQKHTFRLKSEDLSFHRFYTAHKNAFPLYNEFRKVMYSLCYFLWDSPLIDDSNTFRPTYHICKNPFPCPTSAPLPFSFSEESISTNTKKVKILNEIKNYYFPKLDSFELLRYEVKEFHWRIRTLEKNSRAVEFFFWALLRASNGHCYPASNNSSRSDSVTRHIAWCVYEYHRTCIVNHGLSCHSAVGCLKYRESPQKKHRYH